jgi:cell wall-associated NlpC family hydrolase
VPTVSTRSESALYRFTLFAATGILGVALACLDSGLAHAEPSISKLEKQVDAASEDLEVIVEEYNDVVDELEELEDRHRETGETIQPLRSDTGESADEMAELATSLYTAGPAATVTPFLAGSPTVLADRMVLLDYIGQDRADQLSRLRETTAVLESEELEIDDLADERDALKKQKSAKQSDITSSLADLEELRAMAIGAGYRDDAGLAAPPIPGGTPAAAATAVQFAHDALGAPYQWGGSGPGYDCSGLTSAAWGAAGVGLPHSAAEQYNSVAHISRDELQPGDLVFYYSDIHHVGMYVGDGKIIHAPNAGQTVRVAGIDESPVQGYGRPG